MPAGQQIWLLATTGEEGVASLGDEVPPGCNAASIVSLLALANMFKTKANRPTAIKCHPACK